jgi:methionine-rich copper-binding protein CopC
MIRKLTTPVLFFLLMLSTAGALTAQEQARQIPKEVNAIAGTYTGAWTVFGVDEAGQPVKRAAWTDVIKGENPVAKSDRAFVSITDEMTFEGGRIPPRKTQGMEGYLINKDGSLGDYFFEGAGQVYHFQKLSKDTWAYVVPADPRELAQLGFSNVVSGQHALIKVVTSEQGVETHRISRVTTVNWKDAEGKERWTQFVSLQGFHKRQAQ